MAYKIYTYADPYRIRETDFGMVKLTILKIILSCAHPERW